MMKDPGKPLKFKSHRQLFASLLDLVWPITLFLLLCTIIIFYTTVKTLGGKDVLWRVYGRTHPRPKRSNRYSVCNRAWSDGMGIWWCWRWPLTVSENQGSIRQLVLHGDSFHGKTKAFHEPQSLLCWLAYRWNLAFFLPLGHLCQLQASVEWRERRGRYSSTSSLQLHPQSGYSFSSSL